MILGNPPSGGVLRGWRVAGNPRLTGGAVNVPAAQFLSWSSFSHYALKKAQRRDPNATSDNWKTAYCPGWNKFRKWRQLRKRKVIFSTNPNSALCFHSCRLLLLVSLPLLAPGSSISCPPLHSVLLSLHFPPHLLQTAADWADHSLKRQAPQGHVGSVTNIPSTNIGARHCACLVPRCSAQSLLQSRYTIFLNAY